MQLLKCENQVNLQAVFFTALQTGPWKYDMKYCVTAVGCDLTYCSALICGSLCCYLASFVLLSSSEPHLPLCSSPPPVSLSFLPHVSRCCCSTLSPLYFTPLLDPLCLCLLFTVHLCQTINNGQIPASFFFSVFSFLPE